MGRVSPAAEAGKVYAPENQASPSPAEPVRSMSSWAPPTRTVSEAPAAASTSTVFVEPAATVETVLGVISSMIGVISPSAARAGSENSIRQSAVKTAAARAVFAAALDAKECKMLILLTVRAR